MRAIVQTNYRTFSDEFADEKTNSRMISDEFADAVRGNPNEKAHPCNRVGFRYEVCQSFVMDLVPVFVFILFVVPDPSVTISAEVIVSVLCGVCTDNL